MARASRTVHHSRGTGRPFNDLDAALVVSAFVLCLPAAGTQAANPCWRTLANLTAHDLHQSRVIMSEVVAEVANMN